MPFAFEDLQVYQRSLDFAVAVIDEVDQIETPRRHYRLIEQLESSCTSVTLNISEGKGRYSKKEFRLFLYVARDSLCETVTMSQIFGKKKWQKECTYFRLYAEAQEIHKMLSGLIRSI